MHVTTSLPTHMPKGCDHQPLDGEQPRDSLGGNSPRGDLLRKPPFNPPIGPFGWPTPNPRMFIPPWYQPLVVQLVSKPTIELPYRKLQYPTFIKDSSPNVHIKVFKKAIKANGEIIKSDIINLFGLLSGIVSMNGEKTTFKTIQIAFLKSWGEHFTNNSK